MTYTLADIADKGLVYLRDGRIVWETTLLGSGWTHGTIDRLCGIVADNTIEDTDGERIDWPAVEREWDERDKV